MNSLTTSAFDLPDRLAAKADPALIGGDEQHFVDGVDDQSDRGAGDLDDQDS